MSATQMQTAREVRARGMRRKRMKIETRSRLARLEVLRWRENATGCFASPPPPGDSDFALI